MRSRPASWITLVGLASISLACSGDVITPTAPIDGLGGALATEKKPVKSKTIPLIVTFRDGPTDGFKSDGSAYVDGVGGVEAWIMTNGNFHLSVQQGISPLRKLCFNFPDGAIGPPFDEPAKEGCDDGRMNTSQPSLEGGLPAMAVGDTMTYRSHPFWLIEDTDGTLQQWALSFGDDCNGNVVYENRLEITRIDADTWTIENGVTVNAILCKSPGGKQKGKPTGKTEAWRGTVPFSLTASVKNPQ